MRGEGSGRYRMVQRILGPVRCVGVAGVDLARCGALKAIDAEAVVVLEGFVHLVGFRFLFVAPEVAPLVI